LLDSFSFFEATVGNILVLEYICFGATGLVASGYILANFNAHPSKGAAINIAQVLVLSVFLIGIGGTLVSNFKILIGGSLCKHITIDQWRP
jgi:hypothetical protein